MKSREQYLLYASLLSYASNTEAKFDGAFRGLASDAVNACLQKYPDGTARLSCNDMLACIFNEQLSNTEQTIVNSGMAILGLLPTVLTMLGSTNRELLYISAQHPILALLLSISNPSTTIVRTPWKPTSGPITSSTILHEYEIILNQPRRAKTPDTEGSIKNYIILGIIYIVTTFGAAAILWRTAAIARNAVVAWACWTSFYPIVYVAGGPFQHLLNVSLGTLCVRYGGKHKKMLAVLIETLIGGIGKSLYVFGTCVFSSLLLVSGTNAVKLVAEFAAVAAVSRMATFYLLTRSMHIQLGTSEPQVSPGVMPEDCSLQSDEKVDLPGTA